MSIVSSRGGMHNEVVPVGSNGIPIVVAAQFIECAKLLNSCRYVETHNFVVHTILGLIQKPTQQNPGIVCGVLPCRAFGCKL